MSTPANQLNFGQSSDVLDFSSPDVLDFSSQDALDFSPQVQGEEERKKRAEEWLKNIAQNPLGELGDVLYNPSEQELTPVQDFVARSVLTTAKKLTATMDTLRLIEQQGKAGAYPTFSDNFDYLTDPQKFMAAKPGLLTSGILETAKEALVEVPRTFFIHNSPFLDPESQTLLSDFTQKTDQTVANLKLDFETKYGGLSQGMKDLQKAEWGDWGQVREAFKNDTGGILRDMGTEAAGYIATLALTRKLPGAGNAQVTYAGASSFGLNFGQNVQDSLAAGKKVNEALDDGLTKTYADVLGDTMGLGLAGLKFAKKKIYDRMWQFGADSVGSTLLTAQSRDAVSEDLSFGDLVASFGSNVFFSTPAEIFSAVKEHQYDKAIKDALPSVAYTGNATEMNFTNMSSFLDAEAKFLQNQQELIDNTTLTLEDSDLPPPTNEELRFARDVDSLGQNEAGRASAPNSGVSQYASNLGTIHPFQKVKQVMDSFGLEITVGPNGGELKTPRKIEETDIKPGKVTLAWDMTANQRERATLFDGDTTSPEAILVKRKEDLQKQIWTDAQQTAQKFIEAFNPQLGLVITNKTLNAPKLDAEGKPIKQNIVGSMTFLEPDANGKPRGVLSLNENFFYRQDDSIRQADGSPTLVYDKANMLSTLVHEFGHKYILDKVQKMSPEALTGLRASYDSIISTISDLPFKDAIQILHPKAAIPGWLRKVPASEHQFPYRQFQPKETLNYAYSFREFLANQFAKAVLEDDKAQSVVPELRPFVEDIKARTKQIESSLAKEFPDAQKTLTNAFLDTLLGERVDRERNLLKGGKKTEKLYSPQTFNQTWSKLETGENVFQIKTESAINSIEDTNLPAPERRAMKRAILALGADAQTKPNLDHYELATTFDKYLQFESDVQKKWDALNPVTKMVQKILKNDPGTPETIAKAAGSGRIAAIAANLFQMGELNPNIRELHIYNAERDAGQAERNQELYDAETLISTIQNKPKAELENMARLLTDLSVGRITISGEDAQARRAKELQILAQYKLPPTSGKALSTILKFFRGKLEKLESLELTQVMEKWQEGLLSTEKMNEFSSNIKRRYTLLKQTPYFPLMRFGREAVIVKEKESGKTVHREHYESKNEADRAFERLKSGVSIDSTLAITRDTVDKRKTQTPDLPYGIFEGLQERLKDELDVDETVLKEIRDYLGEQARDNSFAKRLMGRKGIEGSSTDLLRIIRRYAESYGAFYSGLAHSSKMGKAISDLSRDIDLRVKRANDLEDGKEIDQRAGLKAIRDYMTEHFDYIKSPVQELEGLKALGFFWHLGNDVVSAAVNTTSIATFVYPHLARFVEDSKAVNILAKSIADVTKGMRDNNHRISKLEQSTLEALEKDGTLTQSLPLEFAALALDKSSNFKAINKMKEIAHTALHASAGMFQGTEHFSRQVTALAAIRVAQERGITDQKGLQEFAKHTVRTTLFEYSRGNRAWLTRNWRSVLFLFQQFTHNGLFYLSRGNGASMRYLALMLGLAGAQGVPGGEDIMDMMDVFCNIASKDKCDIRKGLREISEGFGLDSDLVMHGGSRYGFGIPDLLQSVSGVDVPDVDLSSRLSAGRAIPFGLLDTANKLSAGQELKDGATQSLENTSGAVGSIFWNMLEGLEGVRNNPSDWKSYEKMLPRAVKQLSAGARWLAQGGETNANGAQVLETDYRDSHDVMQAAGKMLGLNPTELTKKQELSYMQYQHYQYWASQRSGLLEQYRNFMTQELESPSKDGNEGRRTIQDILDFNSTAPAGFQINVKTLKTSVRQGVLRNALKNQGFVSGTIQSDSFREYEDLFYNRPTTEPQTVIFEL